MISTHQHSQLDIHSPLGQAWEQLVLTNPASGFMQSLAWAEVKRQGGLETLHITLQQGDQLIGGAIFYVPTTPSAGTLLIAPQGPVLPWKSAELARLALKSLRTAAEDLANTYHVIGIRIEPLIPVPRPSLFRDWSRAPVDMLGLETLELDLTQSLDAILAQMKPKGRYNIRLAARRGITTRCTTATQEIPLFYNIFQEASERDQFYIEPMDHFSHILREFSATGHAQLIFAESQSTTLGAMLLITYGSRATYLYGGISNQQRSSMAGYALQWQAIQIAKAAGCTIYDFYGYESTGDPNHYYAGFSRFKRLFGGTPVSFIGAQDFYWPDRVADMVIQAVKELSG